MRTHRHGTVGAARATRPRRAPMRERLAACTAAAALLGMMACSSSSSAPAAADVDDQGTPEPHIALADGVMSGLVVRADGAPVAGARVELRYAGVPDTPPDVVATTRPGPNGSVGAPNVMGPVGVALTDGRGTFRLDNLPTLPLDVRVVPPAASGLAEQVVRDVAVPHSRDGATVRVVLSP